MPCNAVRAPLPQDWIGLLAHETVEFDTMVNQKIREMALLLGPAELSLQIGATIKKAVVSKIESMLPGRHDKGPFPFHDYTDYRQIFFPNQAKQQYEDLVPKEDLSAFSTALLCASIKVSAAGGLGNQLIESKFNADIQEYNSRLTPHMTIIYAAALRDQWPAFKSLYDEVSVDLDAARAEYRQILIDGANDHALWQASGQWKSPDYECFHHWAKYMALGASQDQVDTLITDLKSVGFPIPNAADVQNWRTWGSYGYTPCSHLDIDGDARDGISQTTYIPVPSEFPVAMESGYAWDFTSDGQPGEKYRERPSGGSCFRAGAVALLGDRRTLKAIESLKPGEQLWSPAAQRPVSIAAIARPSLAGRALFSLNGESDFQFTDTHPFIVDSQDLHAPNIACHAPAALSRFSPTYGALGIQRLSPDADARLLQVRVNEDGSLTESAITVDTVETMVQPIDADTMEEWILRVKEEQSCRCFLYDIILENTVLPNGGLLVDYVAGTPNMLLRVGTELPPLASAETNLLIILHSVINAIAELTLPFDQSISSAQNDNSAETWHRSAVFYKNSAVIEAITHSAWLPAAIAATESAEFSCDNSSAPTETEISISKIGDLFFLRSDATVESGHFGFRPAMSRLYGLFVGTHTSEIRAYLELGFRAFPSVRGLSSGLLTDDTVVAVSIWGVEFDAHNLRGDAAHCQHSQITTLEAFLLTDLTHGMKCHPPLGVAVSPVVGKQACFWTTCNDRRIFYFPLAGSEVVGRESCIFQLNVVVSDDLQLEGNKTIYLEARNPYKTVTISLGQRRGEMLTENPFDTPSPPRKNIQEGRLLMDTRLLTSQEVNEERRRAQAGWSSEHANALAIKLSRVAGPAYLQLVARTLEKMIGF